jgi:hypothetical protein
VILIIAVLAIALLIALAWAYEVKRTSKKYKQLWFDELDISSALRNEKHHESERVMIAQEQVTALKQEIADINASFKNLLAEQKDELGFGHHFKWRSVRKPTSQTYRILFDIDPNGQRILEDLTVRFKRNAFAESERETCRRLGRAEVVDYIINRINTASNSGYSEQLELAHMEQNDE